jgi:hypothetical protein
MSTGSYNDILKRAREELSGEERQRLIEDLVKSAPSANGTHAGGRSLFDALNDRGLIGFMQDGPTDLSTNPQHMEGFGQHAE